MSSVCDFILLSFALLFALLPELLKALERFLALQKELAALLLREAGRTVHCEDKGELIKIMKRRKVPISSSLCS